MDRRDSIKSLLLGSVAAGLALNGCVEAKPEVEEIASNDPVYGRTDKEKLRDKELHAKTFFTEYELSTIAVLCDIILPSNEEYGSATDAGVKEFIDFIVKDLPYHQIPIRGGLMWLDGYSNKLYNKEFVSCTNAEQLAICDQIAYPEKTKPELKQGEHFFSLMRDLTLTGYYTSEMGFKDLGYKGNTPTVWDGIPEDILKDHQVRYDEEWLAKCVDQSKRGDLAEWDDDGNLMT